MIYRVGAKYKCIPGGVPGIRGYCCGSRKRPCPGHIVRKYDKTHRWVESAEHPYGIWVKQVKETLKPVIIIGI